MKGKGKDAIQETTTRKVLSSKEERGRTIKGRRRITKEEVEETRIINRRRGAQREVERIETSVSSRLSNKDMSIIEDWLGEDIRAELRGEVELEPSLLEIGINMIAIIF